MLAPLPLEPISLAARSVHRIENAKGIRVSCVRGVAWITQERDPRDLILAAGQSVVLDRPGLADRLCLQGCGDHGGRGVGSCPLPAACRSPPSPSAPAPERTPRAAP